MEKLIEKYLLFLHNGKHVSKNTYLSYQRDLKKWLSYMQDKELTDISQVDGRLLQQYFDNLEEQGYASSTRARKIIVIKSLFRYLCMEGDVESNPANEVHIPKAVTKPNVVLSKTEMKKLLEQPMVQSFKGLRDRAMLLVLYDTKISISRLVQLKIESVDMERQCLVCLEKGQEYVLKNVTKDVLQNYLQCKELKKSEWLFPNRYGKPMSRQGFWKIIKNYTQELGMEKDITLFSIKQGEV